MWRGAVLCGGVGQSAFISLGPFYQLVKSELRPFAKSLNDCRARVNTYSYYQRRATAGKG